MLKSERLLAYRRKASSACAFTAGPKSVADSVSFRCEVEAIARRRRRASGGPVWYALSPRFPLVEACTIPKLPRSIVDGRRRHVGIAWVLTRGIGAKMLMASGKRGSNTRAQSGWRGSRASATPLPPLPKRLLLLSEVSEVPFVGREAAA